jgi:histidinol-phosphatase (PHP family)
LGFGTNNNWLTIDDSSDNFAQLIELDYQNSLQKACEDYWQRIGILASQFHPTILGHLDLIKMNGRKLNPQLESEKWYQEAVFKCLTIIEETNVVVEINTGGLSRGRVPDLYPSDWIITELVKRQIPIQINSDAHHPDQLDSYFVETRQHLQKLGIKTLRQIDNSIWKDVPIDF